MSESTSLYPNSGPVSEMGTEFIPSDPFNIDGHKLHYHTDRIEQWKKDPLHTYPIYVEVSPVGHCNHRCTFCAVDYIGYKARSLPTERLGLIIDDMAKHGVRSVMYAGEGEPLLHKDIAEIVRMTRRAGIDVAFTTNGVLLDKITDVLGNVTWIKVSMNGGPGSYAKIHQTKEADYERVWGNLAGAVRNKNGTTIGIQTLLLPENARDIEELVRRARDTGLDYIVIKPYSQHLSSLTQQYKDIRYVEYAELIHKLSMYSTPKFKVVARTKTMAAWDSEERGYHKCYSTPYFWAYVMATGDVYGCSAYLLDDRFKYGNINENLFSEIWLGEGRKKSMEYVEKELDIKECRKNCRMNQVNKFLWDIKNPGKHTAFI